MVLRRTISLVVERGNCCLNLTSARTLSPRQETNERYAVKIIRISLTVTAERAVKEATVLRHVDHDVFPLDELMVSAPRNEVWTYNNILPICFLDSDLDIVSTPVAVHVVINGFARKESLVLTPNVPLQSRLPVSFYYVAFLNQMQLGYFVVPGDLNSRAP
uniref:Uncharacterized protein n=1 Tax=Timema douglasi TaxID=61478 RepID=A0A7R8VTH8_TIMDO|nr:unnamed protein product [Timema douglasi]